ncbi:MAG TPA: ATP-binding protein [Actinomycetota bacterium]|nr:ATP-binding protein [Actinomycetota bacterium]
MATIEPSPGGGRSAAIAAAAPIVIGAMVLLGWILDVPPLRTFFGLSNPMVATTAAGFVLCGTALWLWRGDGVPTSRRAIAGGAAALAALLGALKLGEHVFGLDLPIDPTFSVEDPGAFPGEMAVSTAVTFLLAGAAIVLLDVETRRGGRPSQYLALLMTVLPLFSLTGRLYGDSELESFAAGSVVMAVHTALTFLVLSGGLLAARPRSGLMRLFNDPGQAGTLMRRLIPATAATMIIVGWLRILGQRSGLYGSEFGTAAMVLFMLVLLAMLIARAARRIHRTELQQREAQSRQRSILASLGEAVAITDDRGRIVSINPAFEHLSGWRQDDVRGRPHGEIVMLVHRGGTHLDPEERFLPRAMAQREVVASRGFDLALLRRDGNSVPVSVTAAPIFGEGGSIAGGVDILRDISHEHEVDELKSSLVSTVSHEIRTPLTMIQGFSELLLSRFEGDEQTRYALEQIHRSSDRLARLIGDLLSVSKIESGGLEVRAGVLEVRDVIDEATETVSRGREVHIAIDPSAATVFADRDKLLQVLTNLLSNADKYSEQGEPIAIRARSRNGMAEIAVEDQGVGMTAAEMERLFEKFFRADRPEVRQTIGTGLGLFITKSLIEMQGGTIDATSQAGEGTTFTFTLPLASTPEENRTSVAAATRHEVADREEP